MEEFVAYESRPRKNGNKDLRSTGSKFLEEFVAYESRPRKNGNKDLRLKILGPLHFVTTPFIHFFLFISLSDFPLFILWTGCLGTTC